jgi:hypothetical protein
VHAQRGRISHVSMQGPRKPFAPCNSLQQLSTCECLGDRKSYIFASNSLFNVMADASYYAPCEEGANRLEGRQLKKDPNSGHNFRGEILMACKNLKDPQLAPGACWPKDGEHGLNGWEANEYHPKSRLQNQNHNFEKDPEREFFQQTIHLLFW